MVEGFYVAARDGGETRLVLGPFEGRAEADAKVAPTSHELAGRDPRASFWEWGVARVEATELPKRSLDTI